LPLRPQDIFPTMMEFLRVRPYLPNREISMPFQTLFGVFQSEIEARFAAAKSDAGEDMSDVTFEIHEEPNNPRSWRAEFLSIGASRRVRITWNGIASLWACAQGASRICRVMYDAKRRGEQGFYSDKVVDFRQGEACVELVQRLFNGDVPKAFASAEYWPSWAPPIDPTAEPASDTGKGNQFFLGALGWILRHELAHIARNHDAGGLIERDAEREADEFATQWLRGSREADSKRELGTPSSGEERELDFRAISLGIGLIWVAMFEAHASYRPDSHPRVAQRLDKCLGFLKLRDDSPGLEILADFIQVWIRPDFKAPVPIRVARQAMDLMLSELYAIELDGKNPWPGQGKQPQSGPEQLA